MTKAEREKLAKVLYDEYNDTTNGKISYESLGHLHGLATSTVNRLVNKHRVKVEEGEA